jgi:hypothetical protein
MAHDIQPGLLLQLGQELWKVSSVYADDGYFSAQILVPVPTRTTVRRFALDLADLDFQEPSPQMMKKYAELWPPTNPR